MRGTGRSEKMNEWRNSLKQCTCTVFLRSGSHVTLEDIITKWQKIPFLCLLICRSPTPYAAGGGRRANHQVHYREWAMVIIPPPTDQPASLPSKSCFIIFCSNHHSSNAYHISYRRFQFRSALTPTFLQTGSSVLVAALQQIPCIIKIDRVPS